MKVLIDINLEIEFLINLLSKEKVKSNKLTQYNIIASKDTLY